jgi:hypothetical protein
VSSVPDLHLAAVVDALRARYFHVVWVLGAGVNLWGRERVAEFAPGGALPDGAELAFYLAREFQYPLPETAADEPAPWLELAQVSQYVATMRGRAPLYDKLRGVFEGEREPTPVHELLAAIPGILERTGAPSPHQLILTTNYDDLLEQAFAKSGAPFDLLVYQADRKPRGCFVHRPFGSEEWFDVLEPNRYGGLSLESRSVIVKVHGTCAGADRKRDSFVITEDHYLDYLSHSAKPADFLPNALIPHMKDSAFLFLGYGLRDWNIRVILRWIWGEQELDSSSWAVQRHVSDVEREIWDKRKVTILDVALSEYVTDLRRYLDPPRGAQ